MKLKELLVGLPSTIQYLAIMALVMLILYFALILTRKIGERYGKKVDYNDPEKAEQTVPDLFASTAFKRKKNVQKPSDAESSADAAHRDD